MLLIVIIGMVAMNDSERVRVSIGNYIALENFYIRHKAHLFC